jgi:low affinity Fe/Cu permease
VLGNIDIWQLIINTITMIITFLLVALPQNAQKRADQATQHKLNAIADGLSDLMNQFTAEHPALLGDYQELRQAVGLEHRESATSRQGT